MTTPLKRTTPSRRIGHGARRGLGGVIEGLRSHWIPLSEVRAEAWALGGRHGGRVLEGARSELAAVDLSFRRAILLKAVIRSELSAAKLARAPTPSRKAP
jgi:hypothetical protein